MISIEEYVQQKQKLQNHLFTYIDSEDDSGDEYKNLIKMIDEQHIRQNKKELKEFLLLLNSVSNNYHRTPTFSQRFEQLYKVLSDDIKNHFTNEEIYDLFNDNKLSLYLLTHTNAFTIDSTIGQKIKDKGSKFFGFFIPEIKPLLDSRFRVQETFDDQRQQLVNDSHITSLMRADSVEEFIKYLNEQSISPRSTIANSNFETNVFLYSNDPSLIEYAAFYGSIQIVRYLKFNNVELKPSLWLYVIHSKNPELIHFLEENEVKPPNDTYESCLEEAIKCHHNDIANYILDYLLNKKVVNYDLREDIDNNPINYAFKYHNYEYFPLDFGENNQIYYAVKYDYFTIVDILMKNDYFDLTINIEIKNQFFF